MNAVAPVAPPGAARDAMYRDVLRRLIAAELPFLVGGTYALSRLIGVAQPATKDLDLFVRREDCPRILTLLADAGYRTEAPYPHWLAKAHGADGDVDIIYSTGNGQLPVDDEWFANALPGHVLGIAVQLAPMEETLCTKAFVMERERYDGADVIHLLRAGAETFDWPRLLRRFGSHWQVLLSHLILFGYVYPEERRRLPRGLVASLCARLEAGAAEDAPPLGVCRGGMLSRAQYLVAFEDWGYEDARQQPHGNMSAEELRIWTDAAPRPLPAPAGHDGDG